MKNNLENSYFIRIKHKETKMFHMENSQSLKSKTIITIICAIIFIIIAVPFRYFFPIFQISELRPASALPPVFGMMFGIWGALGVAMGNLVSDIIAGYPPEILIIGFIAQFLYGYLPYKLWYSIKINQEISTPRLDNVKNLVKFIVVIFISSYIMAMLIAFLMEALKIYNFASLATLIIGFNNFDFSLILGILIIIAANFYKIKMYKPEIKDKNVISSKIFDISLILAITISLGYAIYSLINGSSYNVSILGILFYLLVIFYICKPITEKVVDKKQKIRMTLTEKLILIFIIIGAIIALLAGSLEFFAINSTSVKNIYIWESIYLNVALVLSTFYLLSISFLWYLENNVTSPIESISEITRKYTSSDDKIEDSSLIISQFQEYNHEKNEVGILANSFKKMIINLENYMKNLKKVTAEKERINTELDIAKKIQTSMLPNNFPAFPNKKEIDVYALSEPAKEVGGDFYDFFLIDENHLATIIADVSGKGIPAALFMVVGKTLIKNSAQNGNSPEEVFKNVNNQLCENNEQNMFVTAWMGILNINTGELTYVNAGHNPPLLKHQDTYRQLKSKPGFVLGGMKNIEYTQEKIQLNTGDRIFLYTDGITEAINENEEFFGDSRLIDVINNEKQSNINEVLSSVKKKVDIFVGDLDQFDDITMLILEYKK